MPKLIVLYPPPKDVATFERRYRDEHMSMVKKNFPGLKKFVGARAIGSPNGGPAAYQRIAELYFDSNDALQAALASSGGQATVKHAAELSTGGPLTVLIAEDDA